MQGPGANDESIQSLVFDTDTMRLYVEDEERNADVCGGEASDNRTEQIGIPDYMLQGRQSAGHRELWRLIKLLFDEPMVTQNEQRDRNQPPAWRRIQISSRSA